MIVMFLLVMARKYNNALYGKNIYIYINKYILYILHIYYNKCSTYIDMLWSP